MSVSRSQKMILVQALVSVAIGCVASASLAADGAADPTVRTLLRYQYEHVRAMQSLEFRTTLVLTRTPRVRQLSEGMPESTEVVMHVVSAGLRFRAEVTFPEGARGRR